MKSKTFIYIAILSFIGLLGGELSAQQFSYKEIYPLIEARNFRDATPKLKDFLRYEMDHPSANFQLALIYEERLVSYHPILQYKPAMKNAERAKRHFLKSTALIDEKEIRRNGKKYYTNYATVNNKGKLEVSYLTIRQKIDTSYKEIDRFLMFVPNIYLNFTKTVQFYGKATSGFAEINGRFRSLKELYLLYDDEIEKSLNQLVQDYDSTLYYFNAYLDATKNYPVTEYEQSYEIKKIEHYRLDGLLTQSDFLAEKIIFWDYSTWVDEVKRMINSDIAALRRQIDSNEDRLNENLLVLSRPSTAINADIKLKSVDRDLVLKLRNYDNNSIVTPLLLYKNKKQDIQFRALKEFEYREDTTVTAKYELILTYFSQLFSLTMESDSLLYSLKGKITNSSLSRHQKYVDRYYNGKDGLNQFMIEEEKFVAEKKAEYSNQIKYTIIDNSSTFNNSTTMLKFKRNSIPMFVNLPDTLEIPDNILFTSHIFVAPDSSLYIGGISRPKSKNNNVQVFLAKTDPLKKTIWLRNYDIVLEGQEAVFDNFIGAMELTPEGIAMIITSRDVSSSAITNTFKIIEETGAEKISVNMQRDAVARIVRYNEQSNSYLIAFKGFSLKNDMFLQEPVSLERIDMNGESIWQQKITLAGNVKDILNVAGGYLIFGNYTSIQDKTGTKKSMNADRNETNAYAYKIDLQGQILDQKLYISDKPFYADRIIKITDRNINLLGFFGAYNEANVNYAEREEDVIHIITDAKLNILKSNVNLP